MGTDWPNLLLNRCDDHWGSDNCGNGIVVHLLSAANWTKPSSSLLRIPNMMRIWGQSAETLQVRRRVRISSPAKPGIPDRSRTSCLKEQPEGEIENGELLVAVARLPQGVSERKAEKECPRRGCFLGDFPDNGKGYRGDSHCFYRPGCQSHGPVAAPSGRNQQGVVHLGIRELTGNRRSGLFLKGFQMGAVDMSHQTVDRSVKNAQGSRLNEFL